MLKLSGSSVVEVTHSSKVIRCGCGDPLNMHGRNEDGSLKVCPTPRAIEDYGIDGYWHSNPLRKWWGEFAIWRHKHGF